MTNDGHFLLIPGITIPIFKLNCSYSQVKFHRSMMNSGEWQFNMNYTACDEYNEENPLPRRNVDLRRYLKDVMFKILNIYERLHNNNC